MKQTVMTFAISMYRQLCTGDAKSLQFDESTTSISNVENCIQSLENCPSNAMKHCKPPYDAKNN